MGLPVDIKIKPGHVMVTVPDPDEPDVGGGLPPALEEWVVQEPEDQVPNKNESLIPPSTPSTEGQDEQS